MSSTQEKRRQSRLPFSVDVQIRTPEHTTTATTKDICTTGLFVREVEPFPLDTECEVEILLSSGDEELPIKARGRVVRQVEGLQEGLQGMGIKFVEMDDSSQETLWQVIRYNTLSAE